MKKVSHEDTKGTKVGTELQSTAILLAHVLAPAERRYSVIKCMQASAIYSEKVIRTGQTWGRVKRLCAKLDEASARAFPKQTSWTRPIFIAQLEGRVA